MIPISADKTFDVKDEKTGVTYRLKYVTDDRIDEFFKLQDTKNETIAQQSRRLVDFYLVGWEGKDKDGKDLPAFPTDGKPSRLFRPMDLIKLSRLISKNLGELAGELTEDDLKNS